MNAAMSPVPNRCHRCQVELPPGKDAGHCPRCLLELAMPTGAGATGRSSGKGGEPPSIETLQPLLPAFELQTLLGRGGMGAVYRARHRKLDRVVAIKVLLEDLVRDPAFAERFEREARALAMLQHPGIVAVHDFGRAGDFYYLVMEFVDGASLRDLLQSGRLSTRDVLAFVPQLCDALQYAHDHRVVHRDIKPENILVDQDGRVRIADFGLAKLSGHGTTQVALTRTEQGLGTPLYMAPEQIGAAGSVDHRADLYSLGVVLYEMLTGSLPIGRFEPPSAKARDASSFDPVVMRSLANDPAQRYQQAREVKHDVEAAAATPVPSGASAGSPAASGTVGAPATVAPSFAAGAWLPLVRPWLGFGLVFFAAFLPWIVIRDGAGSSLVVRSSLDGPANAWITTVAGVPLWLAVAVAAAISACGTARALGRSVPRALPLLFTSAGALGCFLLMTLGGVVDAESGAQLAFLTFFVWTVLEMRRGLLRRQVSPGAAPSAS